jgi:hypothetical protein
MQKNMQSKSWKYVKNMQSKLWKYAKNMQEFFIYLKFIIQLIKINNLNT